MAVGSIRDGVRPDVLDGPRELRSHVDVAWMNAESDKTFEGLREPLQTIFFDAAYSQRAALHAAASMAMFRLTRARRAGLSIIIERHWAAASRLLTRASTPLQIKRTPACAPTRVKVLRLLAAQSKGIRFRRAVHSVSSTSHRFRPWSRLSSLRVTI